MWTLSRQVGARAGVWGQDRTGQGMTVQGRTGQADFAPQALETLVRRSNHLSFLDGPKSLPRSLY